MKKEQFFLQRLPFLALFLGASLLFCASVARAAYDQYAPGDSVTLGDFVYNDDLSTTTTDNCTLTVYDPSGTKIVNGQSFTADMSGWHHYTLPSPVSTLGIWPSFMSCGTSGGGDLIKEDLTFLVSDHAVSSTSISAMISDSATAVNAHTDVASTSIGAMVSNSASTVNTNTNSAILTASTSLATSIPFNVWNASVRTLTSFGSLVSDIWSNGTRSLTSGTAIASDIWAAATRTLTGAGLSSGSLALQSDVTDATTSINAHTDIASSSVGSAITNSQTAINTHTDSALTTATSSLAAVINANTNSAVLTASTSLGASIAAIPLSVWAYSGRTLTSFGTLATDVWAAATRTLTGAGLSSGSLALQSDVTTETTNINTHTDSALTTATSSLAAVINTNTNTAILTASTSLGASIIALPSSIWNIATTTLTVAGSIGKTLAVNIDAAISSISGGGGGATAAQIWSYASRTLTGAGLTSGSLALQSDVTDATTNINAHTDSASSSLGSAITTGTANVNSHTDSALTTASTSIAAVVNGNTNTTILNASTSLAAGLPASIWTYSTRTLSSFGTLATDVWSAATRTLTGAGLTAGSLALQSDVTTGTTNVNSHTDSALTTATSSLAAVINANTNSAVLTASTSLGASIAAIPLSVWAYSGRTLTSFGSLVSDIWASGTRTLTGASLSSGSLSTQSDVNSASWDVKLADVHTLVAGDDYRATITVSYAGTLTDAGTTPQITLHDALGNTVVSGVSMTHSSTGVYTYTYTTASSAGAGSWQTSVSAGVESGKTLQIGDYWVVQSSPTQVIIQSMGSTVTPNITANVRITNEGSTDFEYTYDWCVVTTQNNSCGGGDDVAFSSASKLIHVGENFDTTLSSTVSSAGTYYFKVLVHYGTGSSGASQQFTATAPSNDNNNNNNNSGGGAAGGAPSNFVPLPTVTDVCKGADLNGDNKVNTVDFSILLSFWKKTGPFKNTCVDINHDNKVNAQDFSILLSQWGTAGKALSS